MLYLALILALVYLTFVHYAAIMNLQRARLAKQLTPWQRPFAYVALGIGLVLDVGLNVLACLALLVIPQDLLLTNTLIRIKRKGRGLSRLSRYRYSVATWVCTQLLDTLDPSGCHCRI